MILLMGGDWSSQIQRMVVARGWGGTWGVSV